MSVGRELRGWAVSEGSVHVTDPAPSDLISAELIGHEATRFDQSEQTYCTSTCLGRGCHWITWDARPTAFRLVAATENWVASQPLRGTTLSCSSLPVRKVGAQAANQQRLIHSMICIVVFSDIFNARRSLSTQQSVNTIVGLCVCVCVCVGRGLSVCPESVLWQNS